MSDSNIILHQYDLKNFKIPIIPGIIAVSVALLSSTGNIIYDSNRLKVSQVQNLIQQLGFNASILSEDSQNKNFIEVKVNINAVIIYQNIVLNSKLFLIYLIRLKI